MLALPHGAADTGGIACAPPVVTTGWPGRNGARCAATRDRPHARSAAAVRNRERLVQVQVADVGANRRRAREADLRVHVRAVHVDLAAVLVDDRADFADARPRTRRACSGRSPSGTTARRGAPRPSRAGRRRRCCRCVVARHDHDRACPPCAALAGLVPCADCGISDDVAVRLRRVAWWYARITSRPANSPCAPEFGCSDTAGEAR